MPLTKKEAHELRYHLMCYESARTTVIEAIRENMPREQIDLRQAKFKKARETLLDYITEITKFVRRPSKS